MMLRRTTLSLRRVAALAAGLVAGLGLAVALGGVPQPPAAAGTGDRPLAPGRAVAQHALPSAPAGGSGPADRAEPAPTHAPTPVPPTTEQERIEGEQAAADFITEYANFRYDESEDERVARILPFATEELGRTLAREEGGSYGRFELAERQQVTTATVERVQTQTIRDGWMDLLVVVRLDHTTVDGVATEWSSHLTRVVRTPAGWKVDGFQP